MMRLKWMLIACLFVSAGCSRNPAAPEGGLRIAATGPASFLLTDALYLFPEAVEHLVAFSSDVQSGPGQQSFAGFFDPGVSGKLQVQSRAGPEQLIAAHPTHVVLKKSAKRLAPTFESAGMTPVFLDLETAEAYNEDLAVLGALFGSLERAAEWQTYYAEIRQRAAEKAGRGRADGPAPRVLLVQLSWRGDGVAKVPPAGWMQTALVEMAGGIPVWKDSAQGGGWQIVGAEQIAAWDPDILLLVTYGGNAAVADILAGGTFWNSLRAVQEGRVHIFPRDFRSWDLPGVRWGLGLLWVANQLWPDQPPFDLEAELLRFYRLLGVDEDRARATVLPLLADFE